jgi:Domain of unknown function (DUF397)
MHVQQVRNSKKLPSASLTPREIDMDAHNGISVALLPSLAWQKSRRSNPSGNCVEMAELPDGAGIAVRNSRDPEGPALIYTFAEIAAFIDGARDGDFDNLIP